MPVSGPLGLWAFPLLNMLLEILGRYRPAAATTRMNMTSLKATAENIEKWQIIRDPATGRLSGIEVYREVKEV